ncbi:MAG: FixH family protein [Bacteroidota bacterium]
MNWGNRMLLVFALFACFIIFLVYKCINTKFDLVSKDYYKDELRYQDKIDGKLNAAALSNINVEQNSDAVVISLPKEQNGMKVNGEVFFYCPTNSEKDKHFPLATDAEGKQSIDKKLLSKAGYKVKITWDIDKKKFYSEKDITIN